MKAQTMRRVRQYHFYLAMLFAPAILLFALSGALRCAALQTSRLPETKRYGSRPPGWIVWMASVHKDQSLPRTKPEPLPKAKPSAKPAEVPRNGGHRPSERISPLPLNIFVAIMSIGLLAYTILGILIALKNRKMRRTSSIILSGWGSVTPYAVASLSACFSSGRAVLTAGEKAATHSLLLYLRAIKNELPPRRIISYSAYADWGPGRFGSTANLASVLSAPPGVST